MKCLALNIIIRPKDLVILLVSNLSITLHKRENEKLFLTIKEQYKLFNRRRYSSKTSNIKYKFDSNNKQ